MEIRRTAISQPTVLDQPPRRTKFSASRRPRPTSRTSCRKARRSTCGPPASAHRRLLLHGRSDSRQLATGDHDHVHAGRARVRVSYSQLAEQPNEGRRSFDEPVVDNMYLLVGKRENIPAPASTPIRRLTSHDLGSGDTPTKQRQEFASRSTGSAAQPLGGDRLAIGPRRDGRKRVRRSGRCRIRQQRRATESEEAQRTNPGRPRVHPRDEATGRKIGS